MSAVGFQNILRFAALNSWETESLTFPPRRYSAFLNTQSSEFFVLNPFQPRAAVMSCCWFSPPARLRTYCTPSSNHYAAMSWTNPMLLDDVAIM